MDDLNPFNEGSIAMEGSPKDNDDAFQDQYKELEENPSVIGDPVLPSVRPDESLNQQSPSSISAEASFASAVPSFAPSSQSLNIDPFDETRQELPNPSSKKPNVEAGIGPTPAKRRRSATSECDSDESGTKNESCFSTFPPSEAEKTQDRPQIIRKARKTVVAARKSKALESSIISPTSSNKKRKTIGSSTSDSNDAFKPDLNIPNPADNTEQPSPSHSETGVARIDVEETSSQYGSNDSGSLAELCNPDDLHPIGSFTNLPPKEHETNIHSSNFPNAPSAGSNKDSVQPKEDSPESDSSSIVIDSQKSQVVSREVTTIPTDKDSSLKPLVQNPVVSDSLEGDSNAPPEEILGEKEETSESGPDPPNRTFKSNETTSKSRILQILPDSSQTSETNEKPAESRFLEILRRCQVEEASRFVSSAVIQDAKVPMQENRSDPLLAKKQSESISSKPSTSGQGSHVGIDEVDVRKGQPFTSSHQPVIPEGSSADNQFISLSDVTRSEATNSGCNQSNTSGVEPLNVKTARLVLVAAMKMFMTSNKEIPQLIRFKKLLNLVFDDRCTEKERRFTSEFLSYLSKREIGWKKIESTFEEDTLEYLNEYTYNVLIRIVIEAMIFTVLVLSRKDFEKIIVSYSSFRTVYERYSNFLQDNSDTELGEDCRERIKFIEMLLLQTKSAFQFLLMHIGEHAEQEFIDRYVHDLLEEDKKYLLRRIE